MVRTRHLSLRRSVKKSISLAVLILLFITGCGAPQEQARDSNGAACATRPIQIVPIAYEKAPNGYQYTYATSILDADCNPVDRDGLEMKIDIVGMLRNPATDVTTQFWDIAFKTVESPHLEIAPFIPRWYHSVLGDTTLAMDADVIDDTGAEFLECIILRDGVPVANDIRAVGRAIKVIRPGETIVECHLAGEID
jgi:hypothetical protein